MSRVGRGLRWIPLLRGEREREAPERYWSPTLLVPVESCMFNVVKAKLHALPRADEVRVSVPGDYVAV